MKGKTIDIDKFKVESLLYYSPKYNQILETCYYVGEKTKLYSPKLKLEDYYFIGVVE